ncbi:MAG: hypothetical protein ACXW3O_05795 [Brevundimonas sp.]
MRMMLAIAAAVALNVSAAGLVLADPTDDPCADPNASTCPSSPSFDPWAWHNWHQGPTSPNPPTSGPTCQNQIGDESLPPEQQNDGCILPGGPDSPG